jgi:hypothetical protein
MLKQATVFAEMYMVIKCIDTQQSTVIDTPERMNSKTYYDSWKGRAESWKPMHTHAMFNAAHLHGGLYVNSANETIFCDTQGNLHKRCLNDFLWNCSV